MAGNVDVSKIVLVDDDLRRTFVSSNNVRTDGLAADADVSMAKIHHSQTGGARVTAHWRRGADH